MQLRVYAIIAFFVFPLLTMAQKSVFFASTPALTPDGSEVIFSYNSNLWRVSSDGGLAVQITALQGQTNRPRTSPDGRWIAFSNSQYGNNDVYVMPSKGGAIRRLTFHAANDLVESWSWDNEWIYFTSNRYDRMSTYKVSVNGGTPQRVFGNDYFDYTHNAFESPATGEIFFDDTWESFNFYSRIGYRGAFNPDIQSYNPRTAQYKRYTRWQGKDMWASIDRKGNIYFVSDEGNGQFNLYTFRGEKKTQLTKFNTSVMYPVVSADGSKIVFEKDFQLYLYDVKDKQTRLIPIQIYSSDVLRSDKSFNVSQHISYADISPDGKKLAFISRGRLFVSDDDGKFIRKLNTDEHERVVEAHWLKDNNTILFTQTNHGFRNIFVIKADGKGGVRQITNGSKNDRSISFNHDLTRAVYLSGNDEVRLLDLDHLNATVLVKDEIWGLNSATPVFSPDDQYVMYNGIRNFEADIMLVRMSDKKVFNITNTGVTERDPVWSPDGKYIYFTSDRTEPSYPYGLQNPKVYRMSLEKIVRPFRSDMYDSLFIDKKENASEKTKEEDHSEKQNYVKIDFNNMMDRLEKIGPSFGGQRLAGVVQDGRRTRILFLSNHENGKMALWQVVEEPFEKTQTVAIRGMEGVVSNISIRKNNYYAVKQGELYKLNLGGNSAERIGVDYFFDKNLKSEFEQMFYEAWSVLDENYYQENFNKVNWEAIKHRYADFLPYVQNRNDIRMLLNRMMGELNTSHYGFSTTGDDENTYYKTTTASSGIMFRNDLPYVVDHVIPGDVADLPGQKILPGDVLVKVDDQKIDSSENREFYFMRTRMPGEMQLTFRRNQTTFKIKINPTGFATSASHLYDLWENNNRQLVNRLSDNRVGYIHMKDMSAGAYDKFATEMASDSVSKKDALIFDVRYNTGGNVHDRVLQFLSRKPYLQWKYRNGKMSPQPDFAPAGKPIILLMNEQTLSDGEMTSAGFKALGLGKIVGTETYRWIIFTTASRLVDGSTVRLPSWGCYTLDGQDLEKNGVSPDILVERTFTDRMTGADPQIQRAVLEILNDLK